MNSIRFRCLKTICEDKIQLTPRLGNGCRKVLCTLFNLFRNSFNKFRGWQIYYLVTFVNFVATAKMSAMSQNRLLFTATKEATHEIDEWSNYVNLTSFWTRQFMYYFFSFYSVPQNVYNDSKSHELFWCCYRKRDKAIENRLELAYCTLSLSCVFCLSTIFCTVDLKSF